MESSATTSSTAEGMTQSYLESLNPETRKRVEGLATQLKSHLALYFSYSGASEKVLDAGELLVGSLNGLMAGSNSADRIVNTFRGDKIAGALEKSSQEINSISAT